MLDEVLAISLHPSGTLLLVSVYTQARARAWVEGVGGGVASCSPLPAARCRRR